MHQLFNRVINIQINKQNCVQFWQTIEAILSVALECCRHCHQTPLRLTPGRSIHLVKSGVDAGHVLVQTWKTNE